MSDKYIRLDDALKVLRWEYSRQDREAIAALPAVDVAGVRAAALREAAAKAKEIADQYVGYMSRIERAILALIDKPAPAPDKVGYSQAKCDLCLFLDPDLASADAWGWDDDSVFAAALARLTTPALDPEALAAMMAGEFGVSYRNVVDLSDVEIAQLKGGAA